MPRIIVFILFYVIGIIVAIILLVKNHKKIQDGNSSGNCIPIIILYVLIMTIIECVLRNYQLL